MSKRTLLIWLRHELRIHDNPLFSLDMVQGYDHVIPVFCFDPRHFSETHDFKLPRCSSNRARFLLDSLQDLRSNLRVLGSNLVIIHGEPASVLPKLARECKVSHALWAFHVGMQEETDSVQVKQALVALGVKVLSPAWDMTLLHPMDLPFADVKIELPTSFTSFRKAVEMRGMKVRPLMATPQQLPSLPPVSSCPVGDLPEIHSLVVSAEEISSSPPRFAGGETAALKRLQNWIWDWDCLKTYKDTRNGLLGDKYSSQLSPYLALGCISARAIYWEIETFENRKTANDSTYWLVFELLWRDYFKFLALKLGRGLFLLNGSSGRKQARVWNHDSLLFNKWTQGETGYALIDAAMNELRMTGFMSNRMRQVVASFLVKDMGLDWRMGAEWFESQLVDSDVSSNYGNWQYVAGVGVDPRENRYFNLEKQTKQFDPDGSFRRVWVSSSATLEPCLDRLGAYAASAAPSASSAKTMKKPRGIKDIRKFFPPAADDDAIRQQHEKEQQQKTPSGPDIRNFFKASPGQTKKIG